MPTPSRRHCKPRRTGWMNFSTARARPPARPRRGRSTSGFRPVRATDRLLFNAFSSLATSPSASSQQAVVGAAQKLAATFNNISSQLNATGATLNTVPEQRCGLRKQAAVTGRGPEQADRPVTGIGRQCERPARPARTGPGKPVKGHEHHHQHRYEWLGGCEHQWPDARVRLQCERHAANLYCRQRADAGADRRAARTSR